MAATYALLCLVVIVPAALCLHPCPRVNRSGELLRLLESGRTASNCGISTDAPSTADNKPILVNVSISAITVFALKEDELLDISGWVKLEWQDRRLAWHPSEWDNVTSLMISPKKLWIPDLGLWNVKDIDYVDLSNRIDKIKRVYVSDKGSITFSVKISPKIPCPMDTSVYPFDFQVCYLEIGAFQSDSSKFTIQVVKEGFYYLKIGGGEWIPTDFDIKTRNGTYDGLHMPSVRVFMTVRRKALYHVLLIIVPFMMLSLMGIVLFVATSVNDRVNVAVAVLLAMTLFVMMIAQTAPKSMQNVPMMGLYLLAQMGLLILFTGLSTLMVPEKVTEDVLKDSSSSNGSQKNRNSIFVEDDPSQLTEVKVTWRQQYCSAILIKNYISMFFYVVVTGLNALICLKVIPCYAQPIRKNVPL